ncbi:MAG: heavy metal-associated domain-containing protein [Pseudomonadota bacterium]
MMASQTVILNVEGMSCKHCSGMVQKTLEGINGISNVCVDLDGKKASFEVQSPDLVDQAILSVAQAGYKASIAV